MPRTDEPGDVKRERQKIDGPAKVAGEPIEMAESSGPKNLNKMPFFDMLAAMSARDWEDRIVYLYRQDKQIVKADPKDANYIDKIAHAFDESFVKGRHGGGKFLAILKNMRVANGAERTYSFNIEGPPIIHPDEVQIAGKSAAGGTTEKTELAQVLEQMNALTNRMLDMAKSSGGQEKDALNRAMETMTAGMKGALEIQKAALEKSTSSTSGNPLVDKFLENMMTKLSSEKNNSMEEFTRMLALARELSKGEGGKQPGLLGIVAELKGLAEVARELGIKIGGGDAAEGALDWKVALASNLPVALQTLSGMVNQWVQASAERGAQRTAAIIEEYEARKRLAAQSGAAPAAAAQTAATETVKAASALPANFAPGPAPAAPAANGQVIPFPPATSDAGTAGTAPKQELQAEVDLNVLCLLIRRCWDKQDPGDAAAMVLKRLYDEQLNPLKQYLADKEQLKIFAGLHPALAEIIPHEDFPEFMDEFCLEMNRNED